MEKNKLKLYGYYLGIGFGIILMVAFLTGQIIMPIFFGKEKTVQVPDVTNQNASQAMNDLIGRKIHVVIRDSVFSDEVQRGDIVSQKPEAGDMVKPDGTVYLVVSMGSKYVKVPELVGLDVQSAWITLKNNGLRFVIADSLSSDLYPVNTIVQSIPGIGEKVEKKSKVKLYISKGNNRRPDSLDVDQDYLF